MVHAVVLVSMIEDQEVSEEIRVVQAVVSTIVIVSGVAGEVVSDRAVETDMVDPHHRGVVVPEVMNVAKTSVDRVVVELGGLAIVQAQAEVMTVQEAHKAADSKLKDFFLFLSSLSPISSN